MGALNTPQPASEMTVFATAPLSSYFLMQNCSVISQAYRIYIGLILM